MEANYFTLLYWFCHTSTCICHRYTRVPHPEPPSLIPPRTIPLGHLSAPAPSIQYHALNLGWYVAVLRRIPSSGNLFLLLRPLTDGTLPIHIMEDNLLYAKSIDLTINYIPNISSQKNLVWLSTKQTANLAP